MPCSQAPFPILNLPAELQITVAEHLPNAADLYNFMLANKHTNSIGQCASHFHLQKIIEGVPDQLCRLAKAICAVTDEKNLAGQNFDIDSFVARYIHGTSPKTPPYIGKRVRPGYTWQISQILECTRARALAFIEDALKYNKDNRPTTYINDHVTEREIQRVQRAFLHLQLCVHFSGCFELMTLLWSPPDAHRLFESWETFELLSLLRWMRGPDEAWREWARLGRVVDAWGPTEGPQLSATVTERLRGALSIPEDRLRKLKEYVRRLGLQATSELEGLTDTRFPGLLGERDLSEPSICFAFRLEDEGLMEALHCPGGHQLGLLFWGSDRLKQAGLEIEIPEGKEEGK